MLGGDLLFWLSVYVYIPGSDIVISFIPSLDCTGTQKNTNTFEYRNLRHCTLDR